MSKRNRPTLRLLFDELLPWRVAEALHVLGFNTSYVNNAAHNQPRKGSSDAEILAHAMKTGQVIVTSNHDMIMICAQQQQSVIWIDSRGRQYRRDELAALAFSGIRDWQAGLASATGPMCLRVLRTKIELLPLDRAGRLAERRMKSLRRKQAARRRPPAQSPGQLVAS